MISNQRVYALQNKFPGAMNSGGHFWSQVSYVNTEHFTGMLHIFGVQEGFCRVLAQNEKEVLTVDEDFADKLLHSGCPECGRKFAHKMDCSRND